MGLEIKGLQQLINKLKNMGGDVNEALKQGIISGCLLIEKDAKLNVKSSTGALRESITHEVDVGEKQITGVVGTNVSYAPYVELGTGPVGAAAKPEVATKLGVSYRSTPWVYYSEEMQQFFTTKGQAGMPYLYPALINNKEEIKKLVSLAVQKAIENLEDK